MPKGHPRSARWVALEQAELHRLRERLALVAEGSCAPATALADLIAYGEHCAERAGDLSRAAAEVRARRRLKAAGVS